MRLRESLLYLRTNAVRIRRGRKPLRWSRSLALGAMDWAEQMCRDRDLRHHPDLRLVAPRDGWSLLGENIGVGATERAIWSALMDSDPHRHNLLDRRYRSMGVGVVHCDDGRVWAVQRFLG